MTNQDQPDNSGRTTRFVRLTDPPILRPQAIVTELRKRHTKGMSFADLVPNDAAISEIICMARWGTREPTSCGRCGKDNVTRMSSNDTAHYSMLDRHAYRCLSGCGTHFGLKVNTPLHKTHFKASIGAW